MGSSSQIDRYEVHYVSRSYNNNQKPDRGNRGNHAKAPSRLLRKKRLRLPHQQARAGRTLVQRRRKRRKRGSRPLPDRLEGRLLQFLRRIRILRSQEPRRRLLPLHCKPRPPCASREDIHPAPDKETHLHLPAPQRQEHRRKHMGNHPPRRCYTCPQDSTGQAP